MNCFLFVRFSQVQKLLSSVKTPAYKSTAAVAFGLQKVQTAAAFANLSQSSRGGVRFCRFSLVASFTF